MRSQVANTAFKTIAILIVALGAALAQARTPSDEALRKCERFMSEHTSDRRLGEPLDAVSRCGLPHMLRIFGNEPLARGFSRCWGFFAARRVGRRAQTEYELDYAPSAHCSSNELSDLFLEGFAAENYHEFANCLDAVNPFSRLDVERCMGAHSTDQQKNPMPSNSAKNANSAEK